MAVHDQSLDRIAPAWVPWTGVLLAILGWGSFVVPFKLRSAASPSSGDGRAQHERPQPAPAGADLDPLWMQLYCSCGVVIAGLIMLAGLGDTHLTGFGVASACLWVVGNHAAFTAVRHVGLATAASVWSAAVVTVAFLWGVLAFDNKPAHMAPTIVGLLILVAGVVVIAKSHERDTTYQTETRAGASGTELTVSSTCSHRDAVEGATVDTGGGGAGAAAGAGGEGGGEGGAGGGCVDDNSRGGARLSGDWAQSLTEPLVPAVAGNGRKSAGSVAAGVACAVCGTGVFVGSMMVPLQLAPPYYRDYRDTLFFSCSTFLGVGLATAVYVPVALVVQRHLDGRPPWVCSIGLAAGDADLHVRTMWRCGLLSGLIWAVGAIGAALATLEPLGAGVGFPLTQAALLLSSVWGIVWFRELTEPGQIRRFWMGAAITMLGVAIAGYYGQS